MEKQKQYSIVLRKQVDGGKYYDVIKYVFVDNNPELDEMCSNV